MKKKKDKEKDLGGRPTDYRPEYANMAKICIEDSGFSMYKLAKLFGVSRSTIYRWMEYEDKFSDGIKKGRTTFEGIKIHKSLVKRAEGFAYNETTKELDQATGKMKTTKIVRKYYPPDVAAIKHWQTNMDPENWRDKQSVEHSGKDGGPILMHEMSDEELLKIASKEES